MIDVSRLPGRVMLDSSVLTLTRLDAKGDDATLCLALYHALLQSGRTILIPAPALAEFIRHPPQDPPPRHRQVEVISFDDRAAIILGTTFPKHVFIEHKETGATTTVIKYDTMIVACAIRGSAGVLISRDTRQINLAGKVGLDAIRPTDLLKPQVAKASAVSSPSASSVPGGSSST